MQKTRSSIGKRLEASDEPERLCHCLSAVLCGAGCVFKSVFTDNNVDEHKNSDAAAQ